MSSADSTIIRRHRLAHLAFLATAGLLAAAATLLVTPDRVARHATYESSAESFIVRASSAAAAAAAVRESGGRVTATLGIIDGVAAELGDAERRALEAHPAVAAVWVDARVEVQGGPADTHFPQQTGADALHRQGITGRGVTVAVLDTGLWSHGALLHDSRGRDRLLATFDATRSGWHYGHDCGDDEREDDGDCRRASVHDWNGHGTHIASIIAASDRSAGGGFRGVAPDADLVVVRAFEPDGGGSYADVIAALDWIVGHRERYGIDVLNLSFGAPAASHYWDDPVNLAVMEAWRQGIVVVASAGNRGPGPMTVGVPGNLPYVVTVGAYTDSYTPADEADDRLARFSAAGPTVEGFVKPDLVAPGGHVLGIMPRYSWLPLRYPDYVRRDGDAFQMSGTSQAAAVVSGIVALMLEAEPGLDPDDVKCRLVASARAALMPGGDPAWTVFQQGAGRVFAPAAVSSTQAGCANLGLDIAADLAGDSHFTGPAGVDAAGNYYLVDARGNRRHEPGYEWIQGSLWPEGTLWPEGSLWTEGLLWGQAFGRGSAAPVNPDSLLGQGALWPEGLIGTDRPLSTFVRVEQE